MCGMPIEGAFDDDDESEASDGSNDEGGAQPLLSAIPEAPTDGADVSLEVNKPARRRLVLVSLLAAVVLVGGTTLFITRPWDPHAYSMRATEEADTSMAGFPGTKPYLVSQDRLGERIVEEQALDERKHVVAYEDALGKWGVASRASFHRLDDCLYEGIKALYEDGLNEARELYSDMRSRTDELRSLVAVDEAMATKRDHLLVMGSYLEEELDVLVKAWQAAAAAQTASDASTNVRTVMARPHDGHTLDEWHKLFVNAYMSRQV